MIIMISQLKLYYCLHKKNTDFGIKELDKGFHT